MQQYHREALNNASVCLPTLASTTRAGLIVFQLRVYHLYNICIHVLVSYYYHVLYRDCQHDPTRVWKVGTGKPTLE